MAKIEIEIDGRQWDAEISVVEDRITLTCEGHSRTASIRQPEPGIYLVLLENRVFQCVDGRHPGAPDQLLVNGQPIRLSARDRQRRSALPSSSQGQIRLIAPMPGKVVQLLRSVGDTVDANQGILIVEAMKMQNEVQSPRAGQILELCVSPGETVPAGHLLAVIE
jgi:biotin carboxyl carrier protein